MADVRPVFYVSDGTGITAETIGHSLLTQFGGSRFRTDRLPFVDTPDKAREAANRASESEIASLKAQVGSVSSLLVNKLMNNKVGL